MEIDRSDFASQRLISRRDALRVSGALGLFAACAARSAVVAAQESSPVASPASGEELEGKYVAVRSRTLAEDLDVDEVMETIELGYVPILREVEGFVAYLAIADPASRQTAFVTICNDKAGADASTAEAGAWLSENNYNFFEGEPIVVEGPIGVAAGTLPARGSSDATPTTGEPESEYVVIRSRTLKPDRSGDELLGMIREGFVPLLEAVPGFLAYLAAANEETRDQFSIGIYADKTGADESTARAAEWGESGAADFVEGDPIVVEGALLLAVAAE